MYFSIVILVPGLASEAGLGVTLAVKLMGADHVRFQIAKAIGPCTLKPDGGPHPTSFIANAKPKTTLVSKN